jgi:hypothetical protein
LFCISSGGKFNKHCFEPFFCLKNLNLENQKISVKSWDFSMCKSFALLYFVLLLVLIIPLTMLTATPSSMNSVSSLTSSSASNEAYAQTEGNNTNLSYTDPSTGITFQYPSSWEILNVMPSLLPPETISAIRLIPPGQNVTQGFVDNVIISALRVANTTLSQYTEESLQAYKNNLSGTVTITKSEPTTLLGNPAHMIEYQERFQGQQLNKTQAWTLIGDRLYVVTYAADESEFAQHLADGQVIIESLQISDGAQVQQQEVQPGEQESLVPSFSSL